MLKKFFAVPACLAGLSLLAPLAHAQSSVQLSGLADMYAGFQHLTHRDLGHVFNLFKWGLSLHAP